MEEDSRGTELSNVIRIDDERVRDHLGRIVRGTVEETLNAMLESEADRLCNAGRYERTQARRAATRRSPATTVVMRNA
jgi:putative transposase